MISEVLKNKLLTFLKKNKKVDLIGIYLFYMEEKFNIHPVLFPKEKLIYQSLESLVKHLEIEKKLWRETEIKVQFVKESVNDGTKKIYICPFTGKVFGDNTHPSPQDAIYDWVSTCPQNTERVHGLKAKRFFVSEDLDVIKNYIVPRKEPIVKVVFSSAVSGKLFNTKEAVIEDFKKNHIKYLSLFEVQNQNKYQLEPKFLEFLQKNLTEENISLFVEDLANHKEFTKHINKWIGEEKT